MVSHYGVILPAWHSIPPRLSIAGFGALGVGLFFTLSGFLIGRLLIDIVRIAPSFANLRIFLLRRWMRTIPIYLVWLSISLLCFPPPDHPLRYFLTYLSFTQNLAWPMPASNWFGVSWSLTVEEWFYLLFATSTIGLTLLLRTPKALLISLVVFCVVPPVLRWMVPDAANWDTDVGKIAIYRLDSIGYGVALAWLRLTRPRWFAYPLVCGTIGVALVVAVWADLPASVLHVPYHVIRTFTFTMLDLGFALCIIGATGWTTARGRIARVVTKLSDISYCLYLTHLTILLSGWNWIAYGYWHVVAGVIIAPIAVSLLSWHCFEAPILRLRPRQTFAAPASLEAPANAALTWGRTMPPAADPSDQPEQA
jgi:peptidoglycan/LPS O-acetylase OafA/YrhL